MDRKVLLGTVCAVALTAAMGTGVNTASAQVTSIYTGGATLPSTIIRKLYNCFSEDIENAGGVPSYDPDPDGCSLITGLTPLAGVWIGYATVGSSRGREGFIAEDSRILSRSSRPGTNIVVPWSSTAGSDIILTNGPSFINGNNTIPDGLAGDPFDGVLLFDDNSDEFASGPWAAACNNQTTGGQTITGFGYDPAPCTQLNPTDPIGHWAIHWTTSEEPIFQTNAAAPQQSYDCYEGTIAVGGQFVNACNRDKRIANGQPLQVPLLSVGVTISYNDAVTAGKLGVDDDLSDGRPDVVLDNDPVTDGRQGLFFDPNLRLAISEAAACGLFNGLIDSWDHPAISNSFGNPVLDADPVTVIVRNDGSGTSFVFSTWLNAVCDGVRGSLFTGGQSELPDWNNNTGIYRADGNESVAAAIAAIDYAVGYVTPNLTDLAAPTVVNGTAFNVTEEGNPVNVIPVPAGSFPSPVAARVANRAGAFVLPTPGRAALTIQLTSNPPACATDPITGNVLPGEPCLEPENFATAFTTEDPAGDRRFYPATGFNWLNLYECYAGPRVINALRFFVTNYFFGGLGVQAILNTNGFDSVPSNWLSTTQTVLSATNTQPSGVGGVVLFNPDCAGKAGAGRGVQGVQAP